MKAHLKLDDINLSTIGHVKLNDTHDMTTSILGISYSTISQSIILNLFFISLFALTFNFISWTCLLSVP
ncbi:hypothetical protein A0H76_498 [Hepatospora eriocheir]|uniref:Uncharacterized protein n=1 Tax=Hepatospora eriocheir TaxID=1081669 RepID=A0A1X0Q8S2_9MICR|nr:hypothetical protein A0H76_498 [Hepatospora eriocheir]